MAYLSCYNFWTSEFNNNVSAKKRVQDSSLDQTRFTVNDTLKNVEKRTTNFEQSNDEDVINKAYLDKKYPRKRVIFHE